MPRGRAQLSGKARPQRLLLPPVQADCTSQELPSPSSFAMSLCTGPSEGTEYLPVSRAGRELAVGEEGGSVWERELSPDCGRLAPSLHDDSSLMPLTS